MSDLVRLYSAEAERDDVAGFAAWCVGSALGDWDPAVDREVAAVMSDDAVFEVWRARRAEYDAAKAEGACIIALDGTPVAAP